MLKQTIKLNDNTKLVLTCSYNDMNDVIINAMVSYRTHEQYDLGYVIAKSNSNMCETGYFFWDDKYIYLCDDDNALGVRAGGIGSTDRRDNNG